MVVGINYPLPNKSSF